MKSSYLYILASQRNGTIYIGVTSNIERRIYQHKQKTNDSFTKKHNVTKLVWYACYEDIVEAIAREKQMKKWNRDWKLQLIEEMNPEWNDLSIGLFG